MLAMTLTVLDDREVDGSFMSSEESCCKELTIVKSDDCGGRSARPFAVGSAEEKITPPRHDHVSCRALAILQSNEVNYPW